MQSLKDSMKWDEQTYGREYDLDVYHIVAVNDFNMGAMENKGLNVFNTACVLAKPSTATDADYERVQGVVAHEYFHNWTGNRVTCRDWFQLTLKEGLTVFRDQHFSSDMTSEAVKRIEDVRILRAAQFPQDSGPMAHPIRPESYIAMDNFYTVTVYNKGAEVIRMYQTLLGADGFRKGMDLYFERHDGQAVTCDDFRAAMADANNVDLTQFERWYTQAGTPTLTASGGARRRRQAVHADAVAVDGRRRRGRGQDTKQPFHIHILAADVGRRSCSRGGAGADGLRHGPPRHSDSASMRSHPRAARGRAGSFTSTASTRRRRRRSSAASRPPSSSRSSVRRRARLPRRQRPRRVQPVGRVADARVARPARRRRHAAEGRAEPSSFVDAFRATLPSLDMSLKAEATLVARPPPHRALNLTQTGAHAAGLLDARAGDERDRPRRPLRRPPRHAEGPRRALRPELEAAYAVSRRPARRSTTTASVGRRALRNVCLAYLSKLDGNDAVCKAQVTGCHGHRHRRHLHHHHHHHHHHHLHRLHHLHHRHSSRRRPARMTESVGALGPLATLPGAARDACLSTFYEKAKANNEGLVINKWFAMQAAADVPGALDNVKALLNHEAFDASNPNRYRSVVNTFAGANPAHFHAADGSGYKFVADETIAMDGRNPQVAARLAGSFNQVTAIGPATPPPLPPPPPPPPPPRRLTSILPSVQPVEEV